MSQPYAAMPNRLSTNFACPIASFLSNLLLCPFLIIFIASTLGRSLAPGPVWRGTAGLPYSSPLDRLADYVHPSADGEAHFFGGRTRLGLAAAQFHVVQLTPRPTPPLLELLRWPNAAAYDYQGF